MKIIGEKINGTIGRVRQAVEQRDVLFIQGLARRQAQAGAHWLDVNAGTLPEREPQDLAWLVKTIQQAVNLPLCLDSVNAKALEAALKEVEETPLINSISGEEKRIQAVLPLVRDHSCQVIALAMDDSGLPKNVADRMAVIRNLMKQTRKAGILDDNVYIDPLVTALATGSDSGQTVFETMRQTRLEFPDVHFTMGLSNISYGLPNRKKINRVFLALSVAAGLDTAIMDPVDRELMDILCTAHLVLGQDPHCMNFIRAFREGRFDSATA